MSRQVLILNITRMGDLVQSVPLIARLCQEWPDAAVDLVVDQSFASVAALLPNVRQVHAFDFRALTENGRAMAKDLVTLYRELKAWARPLAEAHYDRIVNLTFNRRSGLLAAYIGAPDIRGVTCATDGATVVRNAWMAYFSDLHRHRRLNRFNLVDLYALGGSGHGPFTPLRMSVSSEAREEARALLGRQRPAEQWMAVQVGASEIIKAWHPDSFGRAMAAIARRATVGFVMIGTEGEREAVELAIKAYRNAGGASPLRNVLGRTDVKSLTALLAECRLLLTNDTGPMHLAVSVGTPVIDLSVGHVDFRETGPYGPGHWVVQPDLGCAPCGFDQICAHHACKDRILSEQTAELCLYGMGLGPMPVHSTGVRIYESALDDDGLGAYNLKVGRADVVGEWYAALWRRYWFQEFTGRESLSPVPQGEAPDAKEQRAVFRYLAPLLRRLIAQADELERLCRRSVPPVSSVRALQAEMRDLRRRAIALAAEGLAFGSATVAFMRETCNGEALTLAAMASEQLSAYRTWERRIHEVAHLIFSLTSDNCRQSVSVPVLTVCRMSAADMA
ncbi:MAG: glycosyltransferase family 9 protein [Nitrospiraceae bacterium]